MAPPTHIQIKDWQRHQHYKDDRPAWIKLYGALLDDPTFMGLSEAAQAQLMKLWLLASRMGHPLPYDSRLLAGKIGCRGRFCLEALISSGLLVPLYGDSRESLDDSSGTKTENREQRAETETPVVVKGADESSDYALKVTVVANAAITKRWGEQTRPLVWGQSYEFVADLEGAGVALDEACASIASQCERSQKTGPPSSIAWFRPGIIQDHEEAKQRDLQPPAAKAPRNAYRNPGAQQVANIMGGRQ